MATLTITADVILPEGKIERVTTTSYDVYRAEKLMGPLTSMKGTPSFTDMAVLVFSAAQRKGIAGDDFEAWLQEVELDFEPDQETDPKG